MDPLTAIDSDTTTLEILLHASRHDLAALKPYLRVPGAAQVQDPETGYTPLHAAISACGSASDPIEEGEEEVDIEKAVATLKELFLSGAIWNDLDANDETPGCLAWRLGRRELYDVCVEAGTRAEVLLGLMGGYERLSDGSEDVDVDAEDQNNDAEEGANGTTNGAAKDAEDSGETSDIRTLITSTTPSAPFDPQDPDDVNSKDYLSSTLTFTENTLLDSNANGVMMAWETEIMRLSAEKLVPVPGLRILNIGFGMGIVDGLFSETQPSSHHIIEAHPAVLHHMATSPSCTFGPSWESEKLGKNVLHKGRWQDIVPQLIEAGEIFDAIYFDTFAEDYVSLKTFFQEYIPALLDEGGRFGFFNGLGADRRVCYDVYQRVVEMDACDAGLEVEWTDVPVEIEELKMEKEGEGEWKGVRRRYWTLDSYRLPVLTFMG
jgi:protein arginine N-methyltransferase 2